MRDWDLGGGWAGAGRSWGPARCAGWGGTGQSLWAGWSEDPGVGFERPRIPRRPAEREGGGAVGRPRGPTISALRANRRPRRAGWFGGLGWHRGRWEPGWARPTEVGDAGGGGRERAWLGW